MRATVKLRWIYLVSALLAACCLLMVISPKPTSARMAIVVAPADKDGTVSELVMNIPDDCLLDKIYLRGNSNLPRDGRLVTLIINDVKYNIADFGQLATAAGEVLEGYENKSVTLPMDTLKKAKELVVSYDGLDSRVKREDLFLIIEVAGEEDTVKKWNEVIKLRPRKINVEKTENAAVQTEKTAAK
jgi:hypothetical protein